MVNWTPVKDVACPVDDIKTPISCHRLDKQYPSLSTVHFFVERGLAEERENKGSGFSGYGLMVNLGKVHDADGARPSRRRRLIHVTMWDVGRVAACQWLGSKFF
jgi:hypothetical protein